MQRYAYVLLLGLLVLMMGCSSAVKDISLVDSSYEAADKLIKAVERNKLLSYDLSPHKPVIVASFVNIDNVSDSSRFGRMVAEQIGSRFAQKGYQIIELKLRTNTIFIERERGEFMLSREVHEISLEHDAQAVIVGTYAEAAEIVYVTAKLIRASDGVILASHDYEMPLGVNTKSMMRGTKR